MREFQLFNFQVMTAISIYKKQTTMITHTISKLQHNYCNVAILADANYLSENGRSDDTI